MTPELGNIHQATRSYERWLRTSTAVSAVESELTAKHEQMKADPFLFFRGTYYRWAQLWRRFIHPPFENFLSLGPVESRGAPGREWAQGGRAGGPSASVG